MNAAARTSLPVLPVHALLLFIPVSGLTLLAVGLVRLGSIWPLDAIRFRDELAHTRADRYIVWGGALAVFGWGILWSFLTRLIRKKAAR